VGTWRATSGPDGQSFWRLDERSDLRRRGLGSRETILTIKHKDARLSEGRDCQYENALDSVQGGRGGGLYAEGRTSSSGIGGRR